jgi:hypothetical protein
VQFQDHPAADGCIGCSRKTTTAVGLEGGTGFLITMTKGMSGGFLLLEEVAAMFPQPAAERAPVQVIALCRVCAAKGGVQVGEFWGDISDVPVYAESECFPEGRPVFRQLEELQREGAL